MITPFESSQVRKGVISYGVSSYGYDFRVSNEWKMLIPPQIKTSVIKTSDGQSGISLPMIDPKNFNEDYFKSFKKDFCIIPPNSFILARTVEYFKIPRNILTICLGKSTYARCGIIINVTPFEPEWEGYATLEITNSTPYITKIYANEGMGQIIFLQADEECEVSYADKKGKYQAQKEILPPKIE